MRGKYDRRLIEAPQPVGVLLKKRIQEESEVAGGGGLGGGGEAAEPIFERAHHVRPPVS